MALPAPPPEDATAGDVESLMRRSLEVYHKQRYQEAKRLLEDALRRSNEDAEEWLALVKFFINFHLHTEQLRIETELAAKKDALIVRVIEAETAEAADAESSAWRSRELSPRARVFMLADCEVPLAVRTLRAELMKLELEELRARDKAARQVDGEAMEVADAEMARLHSDDSTRGLWRRSATSCGRRPSTWCCG